MKRVFAIILAIILTTGLVGALLLWGINKWRKDRTKKEEISIILIQKENKIDSLERELEYSKELIGTLQFNKKDSYYFYDMNEKRYFCFGGIVIIKEFTNNKPPDLFEDWTEDVELATY